MTDNFWNETWENDRIAFSNASLSFTFMGMVSGSGCRFMSSSESASPLASIASRQKIDEDLAFCLAFVWLIDPDMRRADVYTQSRIYEAKDLVLRTEEPAMEVPLPELFHAIDE